MSNLEFQSLNWFNLTLALSGESLNVLADLWGDGVLLLTNTTWVGARGLKFIHILTYIILQHNLLSLYKFLENL